MNNCDRDERKSQPDLQSVDMLVHMIDEFISVVRDENALLARGLPTAPVLLSRQKYEFAKTFSEWVTAATKRDLNFEMISDIARGRVVERLSVFQEVIEENIRRLKAAMEAGQMRINAVMMAVRQETTRPTAYDASGRMTNSAIVPNVRATRRI